MISRMSDMNSWEAVEWIDRFAAPEEQWRLQEMGKWEKVRASLYRLAVKHGIDLSNYPWLEYNSEDDVADRKQEEAEA